MVYLYIRAKFPKVNYIINNRPKVEVYGGFNKFYVIVFRGISGKP